MSNSNGDWDENKKLVLSEIERLRGILDKLFDKIGQTHDDNIIDRTNYQHLVVRTDKIEESLLEQSKKLEQSINDVNALKIKAYVLAAIAAIAVSGAIELVAAYISQ